MKFIQIGFGVAEIYCKTKRCFFFWTHCINRAWN